MKRLMVGALAAVLALGFASEAAAQKRQPQQQGQQQEGLQQQGGGDPIIPFATDDVAMNTAIEEARRTYPQFLAAFRNAPQHTQENFAVKLGLETYDGGREHIWVDNLFLRNGRLYGHIANNPNALPNLRLGSEVEVTPDLISDWAIYTAEGAYGSFTTRVMIERMPAHEAARYREGLARQTIPPGWSS